MRLMNFEFVSISIIPLVVFVMCFDSVIGVEYNKWVRRKWREVNLRDLNMMEKISNSWGGHGQTHYRT